MDRDEIKTHLPGHVTLEDKIGEGGFATVYRVFNTRLQTLWALKAMEVNKISSKSGMSKAVKEALITAKLHHPNVAAVYDVDEQYGFIFMELVDGPSLTEYIEKGWETWDEYNAIAGGILAGLAEAHRQGIVHGDISPRNILLTKSHTPKLVDFGLAQHADFSASTVGLTPGFASPEHVLNKKITPQSDVFSIGAVLYLLATGNHPFDWQNYYAYSYSVLNEKPAEPKFLRENPPGYLAPMLMRSLASQPGYRFASAVEMEQHFRSGIIAAQGTSGQTLPSVSAGTVLRHYNRGMEYYSGTTRQEMDWAEAEFRSALEGDPKFALAHAGLADVAIFRYMSYFDRSVTALAKAELYCRQALELDPERPETHRSLGRIHMMRREFAEAKESLQRAIELDPRFMEAHRSLGWCAMEAHELEEAEQAALAARSIRNDDVEVALLLSRICFYRKEYERGIAAANNAIDLNRKCGRAYYELGMGQRALGQFAKARENFARSIEFHGDPNTHIDLAILELLEGNFAKALESFDAATQDEGFAFLAMYYAGFTHHLMNKTDDAAIALKKSLELAERLARRNPIDPYPRAVQAMAAAGMKNAPRAATLAAMARELDPKDGLVAFYGACALSWGAPEDETHALLEQALNLPRSPSRIEASLDPHFKSSLSD